MSFKKIPLVPLFVFGFASTTLSSMFTASSKVTAQMCDAAPARSMTDRTSWFPWIRENSMDLAPSSS